MTDTELFIQGFKKTADAAGIDPAQQAQALQQMGVDPSQGAGAPPQADPQGGAPQLSPEQIQELIAILTQLQGGQPGQDPSAGGAPAGDPSQGIPPEIAAQLQGQGQDPTKQANEKLAFEHEAYAQEFVKHASKKLNINVGEAVNFYKEASKRMLIEANIEKISVHFDEFYKTAKEANLTDDQIVSVYQQKYLQ